MKRLDICTYRNGLAPPKHRWSACFGEYDEGTKIFSGPTQRAAINELLDYFEDSDEEIQAP